MCVFVWLIVCLIALMIDRCYLLACVCLFVWLVGYVTCCCFFGWLFACLEVRACSKHMCARACVRGWAGVCVCVCVCNPKVDMSKSRQGLRQIWERLRELSLIHGLSYGLRPGNHPIRAYASSNMPAYSNFSALNTT